MRGWIWAVQITCPGGARYDEVSRDLVALCGPLPGMTYQDLGRAKATRGDGLRPALGCEGDGGAGDRAPRWPDPEHPAQIHLDIEVGDLDVAEAVALRAGA